MNTNTLVSGHRTGNRLLDEARTGTQRPPRISIDNNRFTLFDPAGKQTELPFDQKGAYVDIVIADINQHMSKLYWGPDRKFNRAELSPPLCWSDNGSAPSSAAPTPQSPTCKACPHDVVGSAISQISGARIKACQDFKKAAVVVKGHAGVYLFEIKPGSFKAWNAYTDMLRMQKLPDGGRPDLCDVVTRVRFTGTGILGFEAVELVEGALASQVTAVWNMNTQHDVTGLIVGRHDQPASNVLPIVEQKAAAERSMPAQAPLPPPQVEQAPPFVLSGEHPAGTLFPQQPTQQAEPAPAEPKRGRPKKVEQPQAQPAAPMTPFGVQQAAADALPSDISGRLRSLFPKA